MRSGIIDFRGVEHGILRVNATDDQNLASVGENGAVMFARCIQASSDERKTLSERIVKLGATARVSAGDKNIAVAKHGRRVTTAGRGQRRTGNKCRRRRIINLGRGESAVLVAAANHEHASVREFRRAVIRARGG